VILQLCLDNYKHNKLGLGSRLDWCFWPTSQL